MASVATMPWHSVLQNDMSLWSGEGHWFPRVFPVCSIALVTTQCFMLNTLRRYKIFSPSFSIMWDLAVCPGKSSHPLHASWFCSLKRNLPLLLLLKGLKCEKVPCTELRRSCAAGCDLKIRPGEWGTSFTPDHWAASAIIPPLLYSVSPPAKVEECTK